ncbi:hypothetical protein [Bathymodiolus japonicus methanotrophic gill symbiont]|uniref:hypothetical protein n=1 Tax=Bathymodiolus japonicus methanotrophic gill symbiont TaxID=113269 RepID=UPI001C8EF6F2|nr:hypothetical protein [Bathymodiolus japonicus methanotrophic gill symbiont]
MIKIKNMEIFEWCYLQVGYRLLCLGTSSFNGNTDVLNIKNLILPSQYQKLEHRVLGLAFKADIDDLRESPAVGIRT